MCKDIINSDKHMEIDRYDPSTTDASSQQGWGVGRFGEGGYGIGEQQISVTMKDGTVFDALEIVHAVLKFWDGFFIRHSLNMNEKMDHQQRLRLMDKNSRQS